MKRGTGGRKAMKRLKSMKKNRRVLLFCFVLFCFYPPISNANSPDRLHFISSVNDKENLSLCQDIFLEVVSECILIYFHNLHCSFSSNSCLYQEFLAGLKQFFISKSVNNGKIFTQGCRTPL